MAANQSDPGFRTAIGRVRGLGATKEGAGHWLSYRLLSAAYVPLVLWFVISALSLTGSDHATVSEFVRQPLNAVLMLITVGVTFHHAAYGMMEVFEDYISGKLARTASIAAVKGVCLLLAVACAFAVLKIALAA